MSMNLGQSKNKMFQNTKKEVSTRNPERSNAIYSRHAWGTFLSFRAGTGSTSLLDIKLVSYQLAFLRVDAANSSKLLAI